MRADNSRMGAGMRPGLDATCYLIPYPAPGQKVLGDGALLGGCGGAVVRDRPPRPATAPGRCSARRAAAATAAPRRSEPAASGRSSAPVPPRSTATPGASAGTRYASAAPAISRLPAPASPSSVLRATFTYGVTDKLLSGSAASCR